MRNKIYFASDLHLGTPDYKQSRDREYKFIRWLESIENDCKELFIVGDVFDFWHEYKTVVPKGYVRLLGKLAQMTDAGMKLHLFTGNHDLWQTDYFQKELGAILHIEPCQKTFDEKLFFIGHGDGLGPKDYGYKRMKKIFTNPLCQWLFRWLHPDLGMKMANYFSYKSRFGNGQQSLEKFMGEENEWLIQYCKRKLEQASIDYFIFGHRHLPICFPLNQQSTYINLGDWLNYFSYAVWDGTLLELKYFEKGK